MNSDPIIFALSNPEPEISPEMKLKREVQLLLQQEDPIIQIKSIMYLFSHEYLKGF